jgi:hypothetical protein
MMCYNFFVGMCSRCSELIQHPILEVVFAFLLALAGIAITFARGKFANTKLVSIGTAVVSAIGFLLLYRFKGQFYNAFLIEKEQRKYFSRCRATLSIRTLPNHVIVRCCLSYRCLFSETTGT